MEINITFQPHPPSAPFPGESRNSSWRSTMFVACGISECDICQKQIMCWLVPLSAVFWAVHHSWFVLQLRLLLSSTLSTNRHRFPIPLSPTLSITRFSWWAILPNSFPRISIIPHQASFTEIHRLRKKKYFLMLKHNSEFVSWQHLGWRQNFVARNKLEKWPEGRKFHCFGLNAGY